jgi:riboflavin kinase/FMN adenylyltransferase
MQVISLASPIPETKQWQEPRVLVLGFFDGVHRGHQAVIAQGKKIAREHGWPLSVLTFADHPAILYRHADPATFQYLTPIAEKTALMARFGVDQLFVIQTDDSFTQVTSAQFIDRYVVGLNAQIVVAGFDYTFGPKEIANMHTIHDFAKGRFQSVAVPAVAFNGVKVGATEIREMLVAGHVDRANTLLGWTFCNTGTIAHGDQRGRTLGYPTANLAIGANQVIPGVGVYATRFLVDGQWHQAMTSVGYNITFTADHPLSVESHILDFSGDIYDRIAKIAWDHYLRGEIKFASAEALTEQMAQDAQNTRRYYQQRSF